MHLISNNSTVKNYIQYFQYQTKVRHALDNFLKITANSI